MTTDEAPTAYPTDWRVSSLEEAAAAIERLGLHPEELTRLYNSMPVEATGCLIQANVTLRQGGTIGMAAAVGLENGQFCPGIYVFDAKDQDALRWFRSREAAAEYYDLLQAAQAPIAPTTDGQHVPGWPPYATRENVERALHERDDERRGEREDG